MIETRLNTMIAIRVNAFYNWRLTKANVSKSENFLKNVVFEWF